MQFLRCFVRSMENGCDAETFVHRLGRCRLMNSYTDLAALLFALSLGQPGLREMYFFIEVMIASGSRTWKSPTQHWPLAK